jgi:hypothetical protein
MQLLDKFSIQIAEITCTLASSDHDLNLQREGAHKKFLSHKDTSDITLETRWNDLSSIAPPRHKVFDSGSVWQLYHDNEKYLFSLTSHVFGSTPYKIAHLQKDFTRGSIHLHRPYFLPELPVYPLEYPLDELLYINYLSLGRGVEIHASGIIDPLGRGHLFTGHSGAGKSTIAGLWNDNPGVTVLSDDRIILRRMGNTIKMYGTPWHGEAALASPDWATLKRIYFLRHGKKNEMLPLSGAEAVTRLISCSFIPMHSQECIDFALGFYEQVVKTVPCYDLYFLPDRRVVEFILKVKD